ncbi:MAG: TonB-dependent receptor [Ignavibacterium sp.]|nr:MAG: TonB-dependent receptor [Ignavibacterium sp.]
MNNILLIITSVLLFNLHLLAHSGSIKGKVVDSVSGKPIQLANIILLPIGLGATTSENGEFLIDVVPEGNYMIKISHLNYTTVSRMIIIIAGEELKLNVRMAPASFNLAEVTVTSKLDPNRIFTKINLIDIELRPINSSQDVLRIVPGLFTAQHGGGGKAEQIFLRGFDNDHGTDIDVSVDGMPVNMVSHAHGQGYADLHFVIPEVIDFVNFNKGPYYTSRGNFNTSSYVDFKTKTNIGKNILKVEAGTFNSFRTVAMVNILGKDVAEQNAYIAGEYFYTDGYFDLPQNFSRINLFAKYTGRISESNLLTISASNFSTKWDQSGQIPDRAITQYSWITRFGALDKTEGGNTSRTNINTLINTNISSTLFLSNKFFYSKLDFNLVSNFTFFFNDTTLGDQINQVEDRDIYGYKGTITHLGNIGSSNLKSNLAMGVRFDKVNGLALNNTLDRNQLLQTRALGDVTETNLFIYYNGLIQLSDKFSLDIGLRYDHFLFDYVDNTQIKYTPFSEVAGIFSPKLSLFYDVNKDVQLYLKTGSGFHSNDTRSIISDEVKKAIPRAIGGDLGTVFKPIENMIINVAGWILYLESEFVYVGDEAIVESSDETLRLGIDLSVRYQLLKDLFFDFDYNYAYGKFINELDGSNFIPLAPRHMSVGGLSFIPLNGLGGSLRYRFIDDRPANENNSVVALGSFILDLALNYRFSNLNLYVRIENITNTEWNEAQFDTESRLRGPSGNGEFRGTLEPQSISELHFTPGSPIWIKGGITLSL